MNSQFGSHSLTGGIDGGGLFGSIPGSAFFIQTLKILSPYNLYTLLYILNELLQID